MTLFALGVGASTSAFSLAYGVLLRPLPGVSHPEELVAIAPEPFSLPNLPGSSFRQPVPYALFEEVREKSRTLAGLVAFQEVPVHLSAQDRSLRLQGQMVSDDFFSVLGVAPHAGSLSLDEDRPGRVVLSYDLWHRLAAGSTDWIGSQLSLNTRTFVVAGVADPGFHGPWLNQSVDLWLSFADEPTLRPIQGEETGEPAGGEAEGGVSREARPGVLWMAGRRRAGHSAAAVRQELGPLASVLAEHHGVSLSGLEVTPRLGRPPGLAERARRPLLLISLSALLVLLIACVNGGNLLFARALRRRRELAVRVALGASRRRVLALVLGETLALAIPGGLLGLALAALVGRLVSVEHLVRYLPGAVRPPLDLTVAAFALLTTCAVGLVTGLLPAVRAAQRDPAPQLGARTAGGEARYRGPRLALTLQVALTLVLLLATAALRQTELDQRILDPGFDPGTLAYVRLDLARQQYAEGPALAFVEELLARLQAHPQVDGATAALGLPLTASGEGGRIAPVQRSGAAGTGPLWVRFNVVTPGYFRLLGIPLPEGREFRTSDGRSATPVAVVNRSLAAALWPGEDPVGRFLPVASGLRRVVGVAADVPWNEIGEPSEPSFYVPLAQDPARTLYIALEAKGGPDAALELVRREARRLDDQLPLFAAGTLREVVAAATAESRIVTRIFASGSLVALLLAALGVFAVADRTLAHRMPEIGLRLAVGGKPASVLRRVLAPMVGTALAGTVLGAAGAVVLLRGLGSLLPAGPHLDPGAMALPLSLLLLCFALGLGGPLVRVHRNIDLHRLLRQE